MNRSKEIWFLKKKKIQHQFYK